VILAYDWIGTLPGWLTVLGVVAAARYFVKGQGGAALSVLETANRVLTQRLQALETVVAERDIRIAELEARTSLEPLVASVAGEFANHEKRAQERHEEQLSLTRELVKATAAHTEALTKAVNSE
jgi:hypothetical protein